MPKKLTKKQRLFAEQIDVEQSYSCQKAASVLRTIAGDKANKQGFEVAIKLGIDPKKSDQNVRGVSSLPHGVGKSVKVAVVAEADAAAAATEAGADAVGGKELVDTFIAGNVDYDVIIATPDCMKLVTPAARVLGPRGLMPNAKSGTVVTDTAATVKSAKAGQLRFKSDRAGFVHGRIGSLSFSPEKVEENLRTLLGDVVRAKPASAKGAYVRKVMLSSTQGPGVRIEHGALI